MTPRTFDAEAALSDDQWIRSLARSLVQDGSEADDALQEARLVLLRSPPRLADPRPWLTRVFINFVRKRRREEARRKQREHRAARPERLISSPGAALERVELRRQVLQAVVALAEPYRSTLVLRFFEEMSLKEIAGSAGVPVNTVKTRLSRALAILRGQLEARYGGGGTWAVFLLPFLAPDLRVASALGTAPAVARSAAGNGITYSGVAGMSVKGIVVAAGISGVVLLGGLAALHPWVTRVPAEAPGTGKAGVSRAAPPDPAESGPPSSIARGEEEAATSLEGSHQTALPAPPDPSALALEADEPDPTEPPPPSSPASQEALAIREAIRLLRGAFGDGGGKGWRAVGQDIGRLQEVILASPEGLREFLALLDSETDPDFLEAVLHHLPLAGDEHRQEVLDSRELHEEIWGRFEGAEDPSKRAAFLRFFAYSRALSSSRMDDFVALAGSETDQRVRRIAVDAIASNPDLIANTWEVLARALENDPDPECRENALQGLAHAEAEGASALVHAAFSSPDERLRAAVIESAAGGRIPAEVTGGDSAAYLVREFQSARTTRYKRAILKRFVGDPRQVFEDEIRRAIEEERDMGIREQYRDALRMIEEARAARPR